MTITRTATQAKTSLLSLLDSVDAGEEVVITKHGRPVARLVTARGPHALRGALTNIARSVADEQELFGTGQAWDAS